MGRLFISAVFCLLAMTVQAAAGWYQVDNYEGSIGPNPIHLSLQRYDSFGSGITVEGSYFYDTRQSPIAVYGKISGASISLCEIADDKEFDRVLVMGSKMPVDTTGCPFSLDMSESGVTGTWTNGADKFLSRLRRLPASTIQARARSTEPSRYPFGPRARRTGLPVSMRKPVPASA
jgi:hypothetical protein